MRVIIWESNVLSALMNASLSTITKILARFAFVLNAAVNFSLTSMEKQSIAQMIAQIRRVRENILNESLNGKKNKR